MKDKEKPKDEKREAIRAAYVAILGWPRVVETLDRLAYLGARLRESKENNEPKKNE